MSNYTENAANTTTVTGWVWGPTERGTMDILWTSILTIVLCSWNILYVNIPPRHWSRPRRFGQKLLFFLFSVLSPEFVLLMAIGQWASARRSVRAFRDIRHKDEDWNPWTVRHAFLADMGCWRLDIDGCKDYPLDAAQVHWLVAKGYVDYSHVGMHENDIADRDKGGGILLVITVMQIFWFALNLNARAWFNRSLTPLELAAIAFVLPSLVIFWLWRHKPLDTTLTVTLSPPVSIAEMRERHEREAKEMGLSKAEYQSFPLDVVGRELWPWGRYWSKMRGRGVGVQPWIGKQTRRIKIPDDNFPEMPRLAVAVSIVLQATFTGVHVWGWDLAFPTTAEKMMWRYAGIIMCLCILAFWVNHLYAYHVHERLMKSAKKMLGKEAKWGNWGDVESGYSALEGSSFRTMIPVFVIATIYLVARGYIIIESFASLRVLPADAYKNVQLGDIMGKIGLEGSIGKAGVGGAFTP